MALRFAVTGPVDYAVNGAPLAADGPDADNNVDVSVQPASATLTSSDVPAGASLERSFLYWAGTQPDNGCAAGSGDATASFQPPGGSAQSVTAAAAFCSDAGAKDMWVFRADVTSLLVALTGTYTVDGFATDVTNQSTDNASFAVLLIYRESSLPQKRVALYDGNVGLVSTSSTFADGPLVVPPAPEGDLAWYVLDGDAGGTGTEQVQVDGTPGPAGPVVLSDAINPADNPMNHTINTTSPPQTASEGVDLDRLDFSSALSAGDASVTVTYSAGTDKWWLGFTIFGSTTTQKTLTVTKAGTGSGTVTSSPAGIDCGSDCTEAYSHGTEVTLTAAPAADSTFAGWSGGGCSGTGTCEVTMDANKTVTATFNGRPDGLISKKASSRYIGNDVYNTTGSGQTITWKQIREKSRTFYVRVQNDGDETSDFQLKGSKNPSGATVKYFRGTSSVNITAAMRSPDGYQVTIEPGKFKLIRVKITIKSGAAIGSLKKASVTAIWNGDVDLKDLVRAVVKVVRRL